MDPRLREDDGIVHRYNHYCTGGNLPPVLKNGTTTGRSLRRYDMDMVCALHRHNHY